MISSKFLIDGACLANIFLRSQLMPSIRSLLIKPLESTSQMFLRDFSSLIPYFLTIAKLINLAVPMEALFRFKLNFYRSYLYKKKLARYLFWKSDCFISTKVKYWNSQIVTFTSSYFLNFERISGNWSLSRLKYLLHIPHKYHKIKFTSPAPKNKNTLSSKFFPILLSAVIKPAKVTDAVPWISSLKVHAKCWYLYNNWNAF